MRKLYIDFYDYSFAKIIAPVSVLRELQEHFSFFVDGYQFSPKYLYAGWDGKIKLVDKNGLVPFGLVNSVIKYAKDNFIDTDFNPLISERFDISRDDFDEWIQSKKYYSGSDTIFPYWYQLDSVYSSLVNRRRILNLPTSAGKSLIQALLTKYVIENSDRHVLILVPTVDLVTQMRDDFIDYRLFNDNEIDLIKTGSKQKGRRVVISTWQSAIKKPKEWFDKFGMLLCDEMHLAVGASISSIINKLDKCEYKIGLSGSLRDGKANLMQYVGLFGEIYKPVSTKDLMDAGQISKLQINVLFLKYPENVSNALAAKDYQTQVKFINKLDQRNLWVAKLAKTLADRNENVFVMFKNIEHGKYIHEHIQSLDHKKVYFVSGDIKTENRTKFKEIAENNTGVIIVATYGTFSTGISVKNLHHIIFASGTKSKITVLQTIGRVLRKHKSKSVATLWDLIDDMSITVESNGIKRRKNINHALKRGIERIERYGLENFDYTMKNVDFLKKKGT